VVDQLGNADPLDLPSEYPGEQIQEVFIMLYFLWDLVIKPLHYAHWYPDVFDHLLLCVGPEGVLEAQKLVYDHPQAPHIHLIVLFIMVNNFRAEIWFGSSVRLS
jgi:uncharacterized membrane protein